MQNACGWMVHEAHSLQTRPDKPRRQELNQKKKILIVRICPFFFFLATTNIYCYRKEEMNEFMAVNHNLIMHNPGFSSFTAVSRVQSMYIKQVLVDFKITMSHRCNDRS